ncbi:MAG: hypothetical protein FJZ01_20915 [Candidatus Sericytochromatia bacterium]|nr:hypothetical protein [Candidatus Tanganyikabacteria bacterium]
MAPARTLLIDWVYTPTVGHAIEAYKYAAAFKRADPHLAVSVMVNREAGAELGQYVPEIDRVYPIDPATFEGGADFGDIPREWDYVLEDAKGRDAAAFAPGVARFHEAFHTWVEAGLSGDNRSPLPAGFPSRQPGPLRLHLPEDAVAFAREFWQDAQRPRISILPGGATYLKSPRPSFWIDLIETLLRDHPTATFALIGASGLTQNFSSFFRERIGARFSCVRDAFDLGLVRQLAIAGSCDLHVSPHSGMSFAIQCVGVPWLAISGTIVHEYLLNGVPFWSVYPDCDVYPCLYPLGDRMLPDCRERLAGQSPPVCMEYAALEPRLPEVAEAARSLLAGEISYLECARNHLAELQARGLPGIPFFDGAGALAEEYVFRSATWAGTEAGPTGGRT